VRLILASASPRRLHLLAQLGIVPALVRPAAIDEAPARDETPRALASRLARAKAEAAHLPDHWTLGADTVVAVGRRILGSAATREEAAASLALLSGRAHRVTTAVHLLGPAGTRAERAVETRVTMQRLTAAQIEAYLDTGEWQGKAGGYAIQGRAGAFVRALSGSYTAVVGLPLHETAQLLRGCGLLRP
jgi:septum formation protein